MSGLGEVLGHQTAPSWTFRGTHLLEQCFVIPKEEFGILRDLLPTISISKSLPHNTNTYSNHPQHKAHKGTEPV